LADRDLSFGIFSDGRIRGRRVVVLSFSGILLTDLDRRLGVSSGGIERVLSDLLTRDDATVLRGLLDLLAAEARGESPIFFFDFVGIIFDFLSSVSMQLDDCHCFRTRPRGLVRLVDAMVGDLCSDPERLDISELSSASMQLDDCHCFRTRPRDLVRWVDSMVGDLCSDPVRLVVRENANDALKLETALLLLLKI
jgi:hypothetical protein